VLAVHALIAHAAKETDAARASTAAERLVAAYMPIGAVITLLDGVVDEDADARRGVRPSGLIALYGDGGELPDVLAELAREAAVRAATVPDGDHHLLTLIGAVAYWTTAAGARRGLGADVSARLRSELSPAIWPAVVLMNSWRSAKGIRIAAGARCRRTLGA
jgi:hypothetical protein